MSDAARAIPLEKDAWCVDVLGVAFLLDPDTKEGAEFVAAEVNKNLTAWVSEQTAALREENARLRAEVEKIADWAGIPVDTCGGLVHTYPHPEAIAKRLRSLLADPEGQRAGEEWRALNEVEKYARVASTQIICLGGEAECQPCQNRELLCQALAAVKRARKESHG